MKKVVLVVYIVIGICYMGFSQIELQGIVNKKMDGINVGDTVIVKSIRYNQGRDINQYYIYGGYQGRFVTENKIDLVDANLSYWEEVWFRQCSDKHRKNGWQYERRKTLKDDAFEYFNHVQTNGLIYKDDFLYDYLYQLVSEIHPTQLIKPTSQNFRILIIKSNSQDYFAFDNGIIVLTTGLLANTKNESQLVELLTECVSHVVFEHNLFNLNQLIIAERRAEFWGAVAGIASSAAMISSNVKYGTNFYVGDALLLGVGTYFVSGAIRESMGAKYSKEQVVKAKREAADYINNNPREYLSDHDYLGKIAGVVSYSAKQEYHLMNYWSSLDLLDRLYDNKLCLEGDYMLIVKASLALSNSTESNLEALRLIEEAKNLGISNLIDLDKEAGLIYLRLNQPDRAKEHLLKYLTGLIELEQNGMDVSSEVDYINGILYKNRL